ncbi:MAG: TetR/AcrR family transcriptional regulator C-terminal ligand-binding domain-containing protein [Nocardioidaceae bacterium]
MISIATDHHGHRPRVEGERELEILQSALDVLAEVGYDRLTMDAVAAKAKASKATLYRRWSGKADLVVDALVSTKPALEPPDTGSLRGDLLASYCGRGGLDEDTAATFASVITALGRDEEFAAVFRERVLVPKMASTHAIFERAQARGEIRPEVDLDLLAPALAGIVLHRRYVLGAAPDEATITAVLDQIILPAALRPPLEPDTKEDHVPDHD